MSYKNIASQFPTTRMRRLRYDEFTRRLVCENVITIDDLILPLFIIQGIKIKEEIKSMPGVFRYSLDMLFPVIEKACRLQIPAIALFPVIEDQLKTINGIESTNPEGLIPKAIKEIKKRFPNIGIICDVALDPYTNHGQDGIIDGNGYVLNDETIDILIEQALVQAYSGVDIIAPSDMMDGRIKKIRQSLEKNKFFNTRIMAYSAKYASKLYDPFRDAVRSIKNLGSSNKLNYQISSGNLYEALREVSMDIEEGADMVIVKPGMLYLDVLRSIKDNIKIPAFIYQVSGEYSMIKSASIQGWISEEGIMMESLLCFKRAGADGIITYYALQAANFIKNNL